MNLTITETVYSASSTGMPEVKDIINYVITGVGIVISTFLSVLVICLNHKNTKRINQQEVENRLFYSSLARSEAEKIKNAIDIDDSSNFFVLKEKINKEIHRDLANVIPIDLQNKYLSKGERENLKTIWDIYNDWLKRYWIDDNGFKKEFTELEKLSAIKWAKTKKTEIDEYFDKLKAP